METPYSNAHWKLQDVSRGLEFDPHGDFEFLSDKQREEMNEEYAGIYEREVNKILSRYEATMLSNGEVICGNDSPIGLDVDVDDEILESSLQLKPGASLLDYGEEISQIELDVDNDFFNKWNTINTNQE